MMNDNQNKQSTEDVPQVERQGWDAKKIVEEGVNEYPDEVVRRVLRGDEEKHEADNRDIVGSPQTNDTPQQREESKLTSNIKTD